MPDEPISEWSDLEEAVRREDWTLASGYAKEFDAQWREVRGHVELFAGPGAEGWSSVIDDALEALLVALAVKPVSPAAVASAMSRLREFLRENDGIS